MRRREAELLVRDLVALAERIGVEKKLALRCFQILANAVDGATNANRARVFNAVDRALSKRIGQ